MTELIFRIFIKNHKDINDPAIREKYGVLSGFAGIVLNIFLSAIKLIAGLISASVSITADSLNNLSDAFSSVITLVGFKMSGKPADKQHPFGHGRIEYISALLVAILILFMGFELAKSSVEKIINASPIVFSTVSFVILCTSILVKLWMFFFNRKIAVKIDSQPVLATAKDCLGDCIATSAVLFGMIFFYFTGYSIDGYIGLIVSAIILYAGYQTIRDALSPLLGQPPSPELVSGIRECVLSHEGVIGIHDLIIHNYGPTRFMLSLHAEVSAKDDVIKLHDTIDLIEKELKELYQCDAVIHMDPIEVDNTLISNTKKLVEDIVKGIDSSLSIHDFRMVSGPTHTNLIFDLVIPYSYNHSEVELLNLISSKISDFDQNYYTVINVDKSFI